MCATCDEYARRLATIPPESPAPNLAIKANGDVMIELPSVFVRHMTFDDTTVKLLIPLHLIQEVAVSATEHGHLRNMVDVLMASEELTPEGLDALAVALGIDIADTSDQN